MARGKRIHKRVVKAMSGKPTVLKSPVRKRVQAATKSARANARRQMRMN